MVFAALVAASLVPGAQAALSDRVVRQGQGRAEPVLPALQGDSGFIALCVTGRRRIARMKSTMTYHQAHAEAVKLFGDRAMCDDRRAYKKSHTWAGFVIVGEYVPEHGFRMHGWGATWEEALAMASASKKEEE